MPSGWVRQALRPVGRAFPPPPRAHRREALRLRHLRPPLRALRPPGEARDQARKEAAQGDPQGARACSGSGSRSRSRGGRRRPGAPGSSWNLAPLREVLLPPEEKLLSLSLFTCTASFFVNEDLLFFANGLLMMQACLTRIEKPAETLWTLTFCFFFPNSLPVPPILVIFSSLQATTYR